MTTKNDITGDPIQTKISDQKKYTDNYDAVFGNKEKDNGLTRREKVLLDPLEASQRSDTENKKDKDNRPPLPNGLERHWKK